MSVATDLQAAIESNASAIAGYAAALAADSASPLSGYTLDSESVPREAWRLSLSEQIARLTAANVALQDALNRQTPWLVSTRQVL